MNSQHPVVLVVVGTVREGRKSRPLAEWYKKRAQELWPTARFELLDVHDLQLPLFREETPPLYGRYSPVQQALARQIAGADGFVFVTGEYNKSLPASLKNLLDFVYQEWDRKAAAAFSYGGNGGGVRAVEHLGQVLGNLGVSLVKTPCSVHRVWEAFDPSGLFREEAVTGALAEQVQELKWWVEALRTARLHSAGV